MKQRGQQDPIEMLMCLQMSMSTLWKKLPKGRIENYMQKWKQNKNIQKESKKLHLWNCTKSSPSMISDRIRQIPFIIGVSLKAIAETKRVNKGRCKIFLESTHQRTRSTPYMKVLLIKDLLWWFAKKEKQILKIRNLCDLIKKFNTNIINMEVSKSNQWEKETKSEDTNSSTLNNHLKIKRRRLKCWWRKNKKKKWAKKRERKRWKSLSIRKVGKKRKLN